MQNKDETPVSSLLRKSEGNLRKRNRRIVIVVGTLGGGGAERVAITLANDWIARGIYVELVMFRSQNDYRNAIEPGVVLTDFGMARSRYAIYKLRRHLKKRYPDAILSISREVNIITGLAVLGARVKSKVIFREANSFDSLRIKSPFYGRLIKWLCKRLYKRADCVIANAEDTVSDLISAGIVDREKTQFVSNPVMPVSIEGRRWKMPPEIECAKRNGYKVVLSVGRLCAQKDFFTLLDAFARLSAMRGDVALFVLGQGEQKDQLVRYAEELGVDELTSFVGFIECPMEYYLHADVFVLTSKWEGSPNVIVEALSAGLPVVATDCKGGVRSILADGQYGELVPVASPRATAESIDRTLVRRREPAFLRKRAQAYSAKVISERYLEVMLDEEALASVEDEV